MTGGASVKRSSDIRADELEHRHGGDQNPESDQSRLSYRRAAELFPEHTTTLASPLEHDQGLDPAPAVDVRARGHRRPRSCARMGGP